MKFRSIALLSLLVLIAVFLCYSCDGKKINTEEKTSHLKVEMTAKDILGNPNYLAMSYGGYRYANHDIEPTIDELKEDMRLLFAMGVRIVRTYKVHLPHASNLLQAISELKKEDSDFTMYVMLGAWIDCKNAWTDMEPDHNIESEKNAKEIAEAVRLANQHPDIVKIIAVGNEAMVKWATSYYVQPNVILKWVNHLQDLKKSGKLSTDLWITSSDNFASWGGGDEEYHTDDLKELIRNVDFVSMHTYPMHDTHYNPAFWGIKNSESSLSKAEKIESSMLRARDYAIAQYNSTINFIHSIAPGKPIHIGETGWANHSNGFYGPSGSKATDEFKQGIYYREMRDWTSKNGISCFYFEAFDEPWKDAENQGGSENHFGLFTVKGQAKYAIWDEVDSKSFVGLGRVGNEVSKTYDGNIELLLEDVSTPEVNSSIK